MPDDDEDSSDLELDDHRDDETSTYDLPGREPSLPSDMGLAPVSPQAPPGGEGVTTDESTVDGEPLGGADWVEDVEDAGSGHPSTTGEEPGAGEPGKGAPGAGSGHAGMMSQRAAPVPPLFTLTLTFRMKDGWGWGCEPAVQALVGQRSPAGALPPAVPPLARVLRLAARDGAENADFTLLGAQVSDLLAAYALTREAAAQAEQQKKKAQAATARQRKRDEESRRLLTAACPATGGAVAAGQTTAAATMAQRPAASAPSSPAAGEARPASGPVAAEPPSADTTQLSLFG